MTRELTGIALPLTGLLLFGLVAGTGPATALYIQTPLLLHASDHEADVGDTLTFTIEARNESEAAAWAGETVTVRYVFDENETGEGAGAPDSETSSASMQDRVLLEELVLGNRADGSFEWTVPEDVRDHNVDVRLESREGEALAFAHVAIGDAPPQMRMMAGSGPAEPDQGAPEPDTEAGGNAADDDARNATPAIGAIAVLGVGAVALALRRK